jgi:hypothetical protein
VRLGNHHALPAPFRRVGARSGAPDGPRPVRGAPVAPDGA